MNTTLAVPMAEVGRYTKTARVSAAWMGAARRRARSPMIRFTGGALEISG
jgi:hypothetical protein